MTFCLQCPHHISGNCSIVDRAQIGQKQQRRLVWKRNRKNLMTFTFGTEASKKITIITAVIMWLGLWGIAFCFPGNVATWCLMAPKPRGTDLPTMANLQNTCRIQTLEDTLPGAPKPVRSITSALLEGRLCQLAFHRHQDSHTRGVLKTAVSPWAGLL